MSDILDLDALSPKPKQMKMGGKLIDVYPPKILHLLDLERVWKELSSGKLTGQDAHRTIMDALLPIIPSMKDDKTIDFTLDQLGLLLRFAQSIAVPENLTKDLPKDSGQGEKKG